MNTHATKFGMLAGTLALAGAMLAFAQTPSQTPPEKSPAPDKSRTPVNPPPQHRPDVATPAGVMDTPPYAQALSGMLAQNAVELFKDKDFKGEKTSLANFSTAHQIGTLNQLADTFDNDGSSMKWNLLPGELVILFDGPDGAGKQLALWGKGQIADLDSVDFENATSRWAWYDLGRSGEPRSAESMSMPYGAGVLGSTLDQGSIQTFENQQFAGSEQQIISAVTTKPAGIWNKLPGDKENGLSSLRWNLPDAVIVLFSADDDGGNNIAIFGQGQNADLGAIDFDNRASRWTWANIGGSPDLPEGRAPSTPDTGAPRQPTMLPK